MEHHSMMVPAEGDEKGAPAAAVSSPSACSSALSSALSSVLSLASVPTYADVAADIVEHVLVCRDILSSWTSFCDNDCFFQVLPTLNRCFAAKFAQDTLYQQQCRQRFLMSEYHFSSFARWPWKNLLTSTQHAALSATLPKGSDTFELYYSEEKREGYVERKLTIREWQLKTPKPWRQECRTLYAIIKRAEALMYGSLMKLTATDKTATQLSLSSSLSSIFSGADFGTVTTSTHDQYYYHLPRWLQLFLIDSYTSQSLNGVCQRYGEHQLIGSQYDRNRTIDGVLSSLTFGDHGRIGTGLPGDVQRWNLLVKKHTTSIAWFAWKEENAAPQTITGIWIAPIPNHLKKQHRFYQQFMEERRTLHVQTGSGATTPVHPPPNPTVAFDLDLAPVVSQDLNTGELFIQARSVFHFFRQACIRVNSNADEYTLTNKQVARLEAWLGNLNLDVEVLQQRTSYRLQRRRVWIRWGHSLSSLEYREEVEEREKEAAVRALIAKIKKKQQQGGTGGSGNGNNRSNNSKNQNQRDDGIASMILTETLSTTGSSPGEPAGTARNTNSSPDSGHMDSSSRRSGNHNNGNGGLLALDLIHPFLPLSIPASQSHAAATDALSARDDACVAADLLNVFDVDAWDAYLEEYRAEVRKHATEEYLDTTSHRLAISHKRRRAVSL